MELRWSSRVRQPSPPGEKAAQTSLGRLEVNRGGGRAESRSRQDLVIEPNSPTFARVEHVRGLMQARRPSTSSLSGTAKQGAPTETGRCGTWLKLVERETTSRIELEAAEVDMRSTLQRAFAVRRPVVESDTPVVQQLKRSEDQSRTAIAQLQDYEWWNLYDLNHNSHPLHSSAAASREGGGPQRSVSPTGTEWSVLSAADTATSGAAPSPGTIRDLLSTLRQYRADFEARHQVTVSRSSSMASISMPHCTRRAG